MPLRTPLRRWPVAAACAMAFGASAEESADAPSAPLPLKTSPGLLPPPGGDAARQLPIVLRARELRGRPDLEAVAEGDVELRRGAMVIRADQLRYDGAEDLASARGNVRINRDGNVYTGPELQLRLQRFEGYFLEPRYHFGRTGAGGSAERFDFVDEQRSVATRATYTSCPADGSGGPAWLLSTERVKLDFEANEGVADNAVLRFYGVPILAAPVLSFPLTDERKSGWLPPSIKLDSKSGFQFSVPYYWNIAPNRDATLTPVATAKRGLGLESQLRYLEPRYSGVADLVLWPTDRLAGRQRFAASLQHAADLPADTALRWSWLRVSDNDWWKDFPRELPSLTPRLLATELVAERPVAQDWTAYARVLRWQVLQDADPAARIAAPYARAPQLGLRTRQYAGRGFAVQLEAEVNHFADPTNGVDTVRPTGARLHVLGAIERPFAALGARLTPRFSFNAASYALDQPLDGRRSTARAIPTFSIDANWAFEREANWFGREVLQTLEPRVLYVRTPFRAQDTRLNFDSAPKDFNFDSIFSENSFSGVDRVADAHQVTFGLTTRLLQPSTGVEQARIAVVQRYLLREQRVTPELTTDPVPQFVPFRQKFSDLLLLGSSTLVPRWALDGSIQYNPDIRRTVRSVLGARYSPGPFRTLNLSYRLARGLSEQLEMGWQWPLAGQTPNERAAASASARSSTSACKGSWYTVGRLNYSTSESRLTDSILGFEYDAGCWIGRIVSERLSTGRSDATTRLLVQLELVGLSRLGSNPLRVLKDNIPGYRLLRADGSTMTRTEPND